MKTLIQIITIAVLLTCHNSFAQGNNKKADALADGFKGKIKQVKQDVYKAKKKSGQIVEGDRTRNNNYLYKYDITGNLTEESRFDTDGKLKSKFVWNYDDKGNRIEQNDYNEAGALVIKANYINDNKGNRIEMNVLDANGTVKGKQTYKYNMNGKCEEEINYNPEGQVEFKRTSVFDENGNCLEETREPLDMKGKKKIVSKYNKSLLTEQKVYNSENGLISHASFKYNEKGELIRGNKLQFKR